MKTLAPARVAAVLNGAAKTRILVVGDVMLDQYRIGRVRRISPEAPVPVVELETETFVPGGAANVARNLGALGAPSALFGCVGRDEQAKVLRKSLAEGQVDCRGLLGRALLPTIVKTRVLAHQQQVVRVDREKISPLSARELAQFLKTFEASLPGADAVIVADYAKGMISDALLAEIKKQCAREKVWLSGDPKPSNRVNLGGFSLLTPNRKEVFELAGLPEEHRARAPLEDTALQEAARMVMDTRQPKALLVTLGELGMLLCQAGHAPIHIPTAAQEVYDVSGAGDTVIAAFTLAIATGASLLEAAIFSNHAAGVVVAKVGTATASPAEVKASFHR